MFDWHEISKKQMDRIMTWFNIDSDPIFTTRFRRFIKFLGYKFMPFVLSIATFIILIIILNRINDSYGIEKVMIVGFVIILTTLRGMNDKLKKLTE